MKINTLILTFLLAILARGFSIDGMPVGLDTYMIAEKDHRADYIDTIHDTYRDNTFFAIHSQGVLSYGAHTNTFHLRYAYLRANLNFNNLQFFATLNGYRDTHNPDTNYGYILNNINLYDFGVNYMFAPWIDLTFSGAAVLRKNTQTLLPVTPLYRPGNPGEFDTPDAYLPIFLNAAGLRLNLRLGKFALSYSQGDFRHSIPMAVMMKYSHANFYIRGLLQLENTDPLVYALDLYRADIQLSAGLYFSLPTVILRSIVEWTWSDRMSKNWLRLEQSAKYRNFTLAGRFLYRLDLSPIAELAFSYDIYSMCSMGIQWGTDGRLYVVSSIDF